MSGFFHPRPFYGGGPRAKKPRMGPGGPPHMMGGLGGQPGYGPDEDQKRLMSFKDFMSSQRDDISEDEALSRYKVYKTDFTRKQIDKFFKEHQDDEWFRNKYRPIEMHKLAEAAKESKSKRKELYEKLIEKHNDDRLSLDYQNSEQVSRFLDNLSLLLEGAALEDLDSPETRDKFATSSIFLPNVHPTVDKAMLEEFAKKRDDFLRVAMSDVQPERGFNRRAWITYKQMDPASLRQLCWEYNNHKFNAQETKAMVNKETNSRIRYAHFWFCHAKTAKADLKNVAKLLTYFDGDECPMLNGIKDQLIEETNEEEQILGAAEQNHTAFEFDQDQEILKSLDKAVLYLRVVHSFDYYASTEYNGEDEMPQKLGIFFVRPSPPSMFSDQPQQQLKEFIQAQQARIDSFLEKPLLSETDQKQLGKKDPEVEVEEFIFQNTFEKVAGEKYVCKLTKKKFTAPEYVRKHIITRCGDKLDEVRTDVEFLNNYIADPKRPM